MCISYKLNFNLKLRALGRIPPFEAILEQFTVNPELLIVSLNAYLIRK